MCVNVRLPTVNMFVKMCDYDENVKCKNEIVISCRVKRFTYNHVTLTHRSQLVN